MRWCRVVFLDSVVEERVKSLLGVFVVVVACRKLRVQNESLQICRVVEKLK